jgi:hypothetical protein
MDKKKLAILFIVITLLALGIIYIFTPQKIGPGTPSQGLIEKAWKYCEQFDNTTCNSNKF